jgi:hypothetical protein
VATKAQGRPSVRASRIPALGLHLFFALFCFGLVYRIRLIIWLRSEPRPVSLDAQSDSLPYLLSFSMQEFLLAGIVAATCSALGWLLAWTLGRLWRGADLALRGLPASLAAKVFVETARALVFVFVTLLLFAVAAIGQTQLNTIVSMQTGLTWDLLGEGFTSWETATGIAREHLSHMSLSDALFLLSPALFFLVSLITPQRIARWLPRSAMALGTSAIALSLLYLPQKRTSLSTDLTANPVWFVAQETYRNLRGSAARSDRWTDQLLQESEMQSGQPSLLASLTDGQGDQRGTGAARKVANGHGGNLPGTTPASAQLASVRLIHPALVHGSLPAKSLPQPPHKRWNLLYVIMESTGLRYLSPDNPLKKSPMPFLRELAQRGWHLSDHFSTSNSSPRSIFSLFTGLYPMPERRIYSVSQDLHFPTAFSFFGEDYSTFLVTPAPLTWYFPRHLFEARGPKELLDFWTVGVRTRAPEKTMAKDEVETLSYFLKRLERAKDRPFVAVYYSFVAHWPYPDFGPDYHYFPNTRKIYRYYNNLYLLDRQIKRIYDFLSDRRLLDSTILVLVGDHGEAFGQHKKNWTHSRHSFNENYQTPAIIFQPTLFSPKVVTQRTSHIDLLPTLFDAMGIKYNEGLIQGESLFQDLFRRKYLFLWGNENTLTSISRDGIKMQVSFTNQKCWVYDLRLDPTEQKERSCNAYRDQQQATLLYRKVQPPLLRSYNSACKGGGPFQGQAHPALTPSRRTNQ